jgi:CheY-like chemotaxis protein
MVFMRFLRIFPRIRRPYPKQGMLAGSEVCRHAPLFGIHRHGLLSCPPRAAEHQVQPLVSRNTIPIIPTTFQRSIEICYNESVPKQNGEVLFKRRFHRTIGPLGRALRFDCQSFLRKLVFEWKCPMETQEENAGQFRYSQEQFQRLVKNALEHFHDLSYLQNHPFARALERTDGAAEESRGQMLQKKLSRAIDMLDSGLTLSPGLSPSRRRNIMRLRYIEHLTVQSISYDLNISERQTHRDLRHGEEDLATILWAWYVENGGVSGAPDSENGGQVTLEIEHLQTNFQAVDVNRLIFSASSSIEQLASKRNVKVVIDVPPESVMISTDPSVAKHILINLFSSAVQKSDNSQVHLQLKSSDKKTSLNLHFTTTQSGEEGLLNEITVQLIHRLNWEISQPILHGSRCSVELSFGKNMPTVLVIDDYEGLSRLLKRYLEGHRCRVLAATDGASGLGLAREIQPDAVILDVMMPGMDGWEVLQRIRNHPATQYIPVIICSVFNDPELAYALGASSFLSKPVRREDIIRALKRENVL